MKSKTIQELYADFEKIDERDGLGGLTFKYLKPAPVIHRLNTVFNNRWSMRVLERVSMDDWVIVRIELVVPDDENENQWIVREAYGSKEIERYSSGKKKDKTIDPGNAFKSATSDALKKAASTLGIGLIQLYELDESYFSQIEIQNDGGANNKDMTQTKVPKPTVPVTGSSISKPFDEPEVPAVPSPVPSPSEEEPDGITDVQRTAVEKMSALKATPINTLVESALGEIKQLEDLSYQEGILVIREANKIKMPNK